MDECWLLVGVVRLKIKKREGERLSNSDRNQKTCFTVFLYELYNPVLH